MGNSVVTPPHPHTPPLHDTHWAVESRLNRQRVNWKALGLQETFSWHKHTHTGVGHYETPAEFGAFSSSPLWQHTSLCLQLHAWQHPATAAFRKSLTWMWGDFWMKNCWSFIQAPLSVSLEREGWRRSSFLYCFIWVCVCVCHFISSELGQYCQLA